jgi:hypothetical protein
VEEECLVGVAKEIKEKIFKIKYEIFFAAEIEGCQQTGLHSMPCAAIYESMD